MFDQHAEDVFQGEVGLLDVHGGGGGDGDAEVAEGAHLAAVATGETEGGEAEFFGGLEGGEDVGRITGGGDAEEDVAGESVGFDLAGEDAVEVPVVGGRGEDGGIGGEGDGAQGGAVGGEADDELGDEVLGIGRGASVAGDEELARALHGAGGELSGADEGGVDLLVGEDGLHGGDGLRELAAD